MKKTKLFLSIASMCFALSVLVFGIYAAEQVNYQVNGTIVYDVTDCYITVDTNVYYSPTYLTQTQIYSKMETIVASNDTTGLTQVTTQDLNYNSYTDTAEGDNQKQLTLTFEGEGEVSPKQVYFIVMNTTNVGELTTNIGVNTPVELPNNVYSVNSGLWTSVAQNASKRMVVAFALEDRASKVTAGPGQLSPNYTLTLKAEVDDENTELNVFSFNSGTKTISKTTALEDMEMDLYIPSYYNGYKVTTCGSFADCENLTSIHVPTTVSEVNEGVFANCKSLTALTLPFVGKKNYTSFDDVITQESGYYMRATIYHLFGDTAGDGLVGIGMEADDEPYYTYLYRYVPEGLVDVNILYGCTYISQYAFTDVECCNIPLEHVHLPFGVKTIDNDAFRCNDQLQNIELPKSLEYIGRASFESSGLTSITIPCRVKFMGDCCFTGCDNITTVTIEEGVTYVGGFSNTNITSIALPNTVTEIGDFGGSKLQSIIIPEGVVTISDRAFSSCGDLTSVTLPSTLRTIGDRAFSNCDSLTNLDIPEGLEIIGDNAFSNCTSLVSVSLPETITELGESLFSSCTSLETLTLPFVGKKNYTSQANLREVEGTEDDSKDYYGSILYFFGTLGGSGLVSWNNDDWEAGNFTRYVPATLATVNILPSCKCILYDAFYETYGEYSPITSINLSEGLISIEAYAFSGSRFSSITIPSTVTSIGNAAFSGCLNLTEFTLGDNITSVSDYLFSGCTSLTTVSFGENIETINTYAFANSAITSIQLPEGLKHIWSNAFQNCTGLNTITIPSTVLDFGSDIFSGCTNLSSAIINSSTTPSFSGLSSLTEVTLGDTVTSVSHNSFSDCTSLATVNWGCNIAYIYGYAFANTAFTSVVLPEGLKYIYGRAFQNCQQLTSIVIPSSVEYVSTPFYGCDNVVSIELPLDSWSMTGLFGSSNVNGVYTYYSEKSLKNVKITGKSIGYGKFAKYLDYKKDRLTISSSVTSIPDGVLSGLLCFGEIVVESGNPKYKSEGNCLIETAKNKVIAGCRNSIIPNYITEIGAGAFAAGHFSDSNLNGTSGCNFYYLYEITIPASVTQIGRFAFMDDRKLVHIRNLSSVDIYRDVETGLYWNSEDIREIRTDNLPFESILTIGEKYVTLRYGNKKYLLGFSGYDTFTHANDIPNDVTDLYLYAFNQEFSLQEVTLHNNITGLGQWCFGNCKNINQIYIHNNVSFVSCYVFWNWTSSQTINIQASSKPAGWDNEWNANCNANIVWGA